MITSLVDMWSLRFLLKIPEWGPLWGGHEIEGLKIGSEIEGVEQSSQS